MALENQINLYSVDTGDFYSNREYRLHWKNAQLRAERNYVTNKLREMKNQLIEIGCTEEQINYMFEVQKCNKENLPPPKDECNFYGSETSQGLNDEQIVLLCEYYKFYEIKQHKHRLAKESKEKLLLLLKNKINQNEKTNGKDHIRELNEKALCDNNVISLFESSLTRTLDIKKDELTKDLVVLQVYYFDVFKDISYYGFTLEGEKYKYLTSSAGQIRKKKAVFIKEAIWDKYEKTIMCGLTINRVNELGGINVNKYLAYMALNNSATDEWKDFNIDRSIVIDDFENNVYGTYDFIDEKDYSITRMSGNILIPHTDGAGMILDGKNKMIRLPWIKGLLGVFNFRRFILEQRDKTGDKNIGKIKDIYGQEYDIIADNIQIIFTKSQFKMYKFFESWGEYKYFFKKYHCQACYCNEEEDKIGCSCLNYQENQTLTDITDEELQNISKKSITILTEMCSNLDKTKQVFGVTPYNSHPTPLQESISIYPNLLNDRYLKNTLRDIKDSLVKKYRAGKLEIEGRYTFLLPDFYAACEYWFLGIEEPNGLLNNGEVYCNLFSHREKLDCLRSPHLYREHAIRYNVASKAYQEKRELVSSWFTTAAIYTSCKDLISKVLMFDVDGDKSLVVGEPEYIKIAERNMNNIVPLYYNMRKAKPTLLNNKTIYNGLNAAFIGSNIGVCSNNISKIWNSNYMINGTDEEKNKALDTIKLLCFENNEIIDYAKTLYRSTRPKDINKQISFFTNNNLPHFFIYAKDKFPSQVAKINNSTVNRLEKLIPNIRIDLRKLKLGEIDYRLLMRNPDIQINQTVIDKYKELNSTWHFKINLKDPDIDNLAYLKVQLKDEFLNMGYAEFEIADMLIKELYSKKNERKDTLWFCYGEYIADNLKKNVGEKKARIIQCEDCGEWFEACGNRTYRCPRCQHEINKENTRIRVKKYRENEM